MTEMAETVSLLTTHAYFRISGRISFINFGLRSHSSIRTTGQFGTLEATRRLREQTQQREVPPPSGYVCVAGSITAEGA